MGSQQGCKLDENFFPTGVEIFSKNVRFPTRLSFEFLRFFREIKKKERDVIGVEMRLTTRLPLEENVISNFCCHLLNHVLNTQNDSTLILGIREVCREGREIWHK